MALAVYPKWKKALLDEYLAGGGVAKIPKLLLLKSTAVYNASHEFVADVVAGSQEISVAGYSRATLDSIATSITGANAFITAANEIFTSLATGQTIGVVVCYMNFVGATDANQRVAMWYDGGSSPNDLPKATTGGNFTFQPNASGLIQI